VNISSNKPRLNQVTARYGTPARGPAADSVRLTSPEDAQREVEQSLSNLMAGKNSGAVQFADSHGRVKHLALMLSEYVDDEARDQVLNGYNILFKNMEPDTKFTIAVAADKDRQDIQQMMSQNQVENQDRIQILQPGVPNLTVWARDMMVPQFKPGDPGHTALEAQEPLHNWHGDDSQIPQYITQANPSIELHTNKGIVTDGGDTQSNTKESFVGNYSLEATENKLHEGLQNSPLKPEVISWYEAQTGKDVVETPQNETFPFRFVPVTTSSGVVIQKKEANPDYKEPVLGEGQVSEAHMYDDLSVKLFEAQFNKPVTIMGRDNPNTPHIEEPATDHMDMGMTPIDDNTFFVGDPSLYHGPDVSRNRDNQEDFDAYAKTLTDKGYNVIRLPHHEPAKSGDSYITYNNCLMERFEKDGKEYRRVFLPVYGQASDDVAIKTWEGQGFDVVPMPLEHLTTRWGGLRCISNWLDRSDAA